MDLEINSPLILANFDLEKSIGHIHNIFFKKIICAENMPKLEQVMVMYTVFIMMNNL